MAGVLAGEQLPAPKEVPTAALCGSLLTSGSPGGHILGLKQPGIAAQSTVVISDVLGMNYLSVLKRFLYGELLVPVAQGNQGDVTAALLQNLHVLIVDDDRS